MLSGRFIAFGALEKSFQTKMLRVMKLTAFLILAFMLRLSAEGVAQKVTLSERNATLETIFSKISQQTGVLFLYSKGSFIESKRVTVNVENVSLKEALEACLSDLPVKYIIRDKTVSLKTRHLIVAGPPEEKEMAFIPVTGKVIDAYTGQPIVGASITVKGTKKGASTDVNGTFSIEGNPGDVLVISSVGYVSKEVKISGSRSINVELDITNESMKEFVVTGMFNRKSSTATGAVASYSGEQLQRAGTVNIIQSLKNLEPAFFLVENNMMGSNPNALPDIQVRGQSGLPDIQGQYASNPNNPLFVLDGVPVSLQTIMDLDQSRVKSVSLLLDAASKAIWGSRAANGVLVVETKVPKSGKLLISYNSNLTLTTPDFSSYNLTNAPEKLDVEQAAGLYTGFSGDQDLILKRNYNVFLENVVAGVNTDWISKPVRNGFGQQHSLSFEGGEPNGMRYLATFRYYNQTGVMKGSDRNTLTGALKLAYRVKAFNFTNTFTINENVSNNSPWGSFAQYAAMNPYLPYQDENGNILKIISTYQRQNGVAGNVIGAPTGTFISDVLYNPAYNSRLKIIDSRKYTQYLNCKRRSN